MPEPDRPQPDRPQPVLKAALAAGGGGATLSGLVWAGLEMAQSYNVPISDTQQATTTAFVALAVLVIGPPIAALWARARVTPTVAPQDDDGTPLVPAPAGRHYRPTTDAGATLSPRLSPAGHRSPLAAARMSARRYR